MKKAEKGEKAILLLANDTAILLLQHKFNKASFPVSLLTIQTKLFHEGLNRAKSLISVRDKRELGLGLLEKNYLQACIR